MKHCDFVEYDESCPSCLRWSGSPSRKVVAGTPAGTLNPRKYWKLSVGKVRKSVHNIVWEMFNGPVPEGLEVDHKDNDTTNNRIDNLRLASRHGQLCNTRKRTDNTSGVKGVYFLPKLNKWYARLQANDSYTYLPHISLSSEDKV